MARLGGPTSSAVRILSPVGTILFSVFIGIKQELCDDGDDDGGDDDDNVGDDDGDDDGGCDVVICTHLSSFQFRVD